MKTKLFSLLCTLMCAGNLFAYDFYVNGIYYNKLGGDSVEVTYKTSSYIRYSGSVTIPEVVTYSKTTYRVTTIGEQAFFDCSGLTSITIPNSVTTIGENAFYRCSGLKRTNYTGTIASWCKIKFSGKTSNPICYSENFFINDVEVKDLVIPEGVDEIGVWAYCRGLTSVTIPNSVKTIGDEAFSYCSGLTSVTIPNSVTKIGSTAFYNCSGLTSVTIPNSVTTIGVWAFCGCYGLTSITIPKSVTTIGDGTFCHCYGLTSVTIPNSVTTIGEKAFYDCRGLTSVTIPNSVTTIGESAFCGCSKLTSVTIPNSVTTIGNYAFYSCSGLTSVTIPNSVTTIGNNAFLSCSSLTSITIPKSVTTIGDGTFRYCSGLTSINVDAANTHYASIDGVLFNYAKDTLIQYPIGNSRKEYTIPNSVTTIGNSAFYDCDGLTSITIPNSVTTIGSSAFGYCSGLTSVTIGNSVTTIGEDAFRYCKGLTSVTCYATTPPTCGSGCFYNVTKSIPVYVPAHSVDAYKQADSWKDFTNLQANPDTSLEWVTSDKIQGINKMLLDGHLYILRDGNLYTATGARVK